MTWLRRIGLWGRGLVVGVPYLWLGLFFLVPFLIVLRISFSEAIMAQPPYTPLLDWVEGRARSGGFDRVTLHVWADNAPARRLYARHGYVEVEVAAIPWHPRLPHRGGSVLLRKRL